VNVDVGVLRSQYDPATRTISLTLRVGAEGLPAGWRLAVTSIVQLTPAEGAGALLVDRLFGAAT